MHVSSLSPELVRDDSVSNCVAIVDVNKAGLGLDTAALFSTDISCLS